MIKGQFTMKTIIIDVYAPSNRISKEMTRKLTALKREMDKSTTKDGDLNTLLSVIDRKSK